MSRTIENALTAKGSALIAKSLAGGFAVSFTKASLGTGVAADSADLSTFTALITPYADAVIGGKSINADGSLVITAQFWNSAVTESVYIDEIGIFATDPDEGEVLFSYLTFGEYPDLILAADDASVQRTYDVPFIFGAGDTVSVTITPSGLLSSAEAVDAPTPLKLLRMNADGKLPTSITGDAATLGGVAPDGYSASTHTHDAATTTTAGFLSATDKVILNTLNTRVPQSLKTTDKPTFAGLTVNGIIDGAQFR